MEATDMIQMQKHVWCPPTFCAPNRRSATLLSIMRTTDADVFVTTVTTRVVKVLLPTRRLSNAHLFPIKNASAKLSIPPKRMNKKLIKERNRFMRRLKREREDRATLETWGATKIQATFRGFTGRPNRTSRKKKSNLNQIRTHLMDMQEQITTEGDTVSNKLFQPEWRTKIQRQAAGKREAKTMQNRSYVIATKIQTMIRGYLERIAHHHRMRRWYHEQLITKTICIQRVFRGHSTRQKLFVDTRRKQEKSILLIQSLLRGAAARDALGHKRLERYREDTEEKKRKQDETMQATALLQKHTRGHLARNQLRRAETIKKEKRASIEKREAVTKVQSIVRGRQTRRQTRHNNLSQQDHEVPKEATSSEGAAVKKVEEMIDAIDSTAGLSVVLEPRLNRDAAASKVQALTRGRRARQQKIKEEKASVSIQSHIRKHQAKKTTDQIRADTHGKLQGQTRKKRVLTKKENKYTHDKE